jgi:hypothetical protein
MNRIVPQSPRNGYFFLSENELEKKLEQINSEISHFYHTCSFDDKLYQLIRSLTTVTNAILQENKYLRDANMKIEEEIKILTEENLFLVDRISSQNETLTEFEEINQKNDKLVKEFSQEKEKNEIFCKEIEKITKLNIKLNEEIKISEIEREELILRIEILEKKLEEKSKIGKRHSMKMNEKDKELRNMQRKLDEFEEEKIFNLLKSNKNKSYDSNDNYFEDHIKNNHNSNNYLTSSTGISIPKEHKANYGSSLGFLCPEIEDESNKEERKIAINLTPHEVVRRMSSDKISTYSSKIQKEELDIYKDFFLLTFQSQKLNSQDFEAFQYLKPEELYSNIKKHNIPFHKVFYKLIY